MGRDEQWSEVCCFQDDMDVNTRERAVIDHHTTPHHTIQEQSMCSRGEVPTRKDTIHIIATLNSRDNDIEAQSTKEQQYCTLHMPSYDTQRMGRNVMERNRLEGRD